LQIKKFKIIKEIEIELGVNRHNNGFNLNIQEGTEFG
jgi:hypothetical protein